MKMEKIDQTIEDICERIQSEVGDNPMVVVEGAMPGWIIALAALVTARRNAERTDFKV